MKLSERDYLRLKGVDARLVRLCELAAERMDLMVIEGLRTPERQRELLRSGNTKTLKSKHLEGKAVDLGPLPLNWNDKNSFTKMGALVKKIAADEKIPIRWGGNFSSFFDGPHFELTG